MSALSLTAFCDESAFKIEIECTVGTFFKSFASPLCIFLRFSITNLGGRVHFGGQELKTQNDKFTAAEIVTAKIGA